MKKYLNYFKNKYILTITLFTVYFLFLDDVDIFTVINHNYKLHKLEEAKVETTIKLDSTKKLLNRMRYSSELESFAREEKLFKQDNEEIFVISYE